MKSRLMNGRKTVVAMKAQPIAIIYAPAKMMSVKMFLILSINENKANSPSDVKSTSLKLNIERKTNISQTKIRALIIFNICK